MAEIRNSPNRVYASIIDLIPADCAHFGAALNENEIVYENYTVNVGQVFIAKVHGDDIDVNMLPSWIQSNGTAVFGIPQLQEFYTVDGKEKFETIHLGKNVYATITFLLKEKNVCAFEESVFLEVYQKKDFNKYTSEEISDVIQEFAVMMDLKPSDIRALPNNYLNLYREENNVVYGDEEMPENDVLVIVWVLTCGDFGEDEDLVNTINVVKNNNYKFRITQGFLMDINWASDEYLKKVDTTKLIETTTLGSFRTTRRADHPPKRINSLPSYECIQGKTCKLSIPAHTFIDEQPIETLQYTVYPMTHGKNFLDANYPKMEGVPLENGAFDFRLEARDNMKQAASAPFRVVVKPEMKSDYSFETLQMS
uniref:Uncharacterized protein n=1 Tax=Panagrolaimus superbus TaxID=310955 RepID=A0A914YET5_9BILA